MSQVRLRQGPQGQPALPLAEGVWHQLSGTGLALDASWQVLGPVLAEQPSLEAVKDRLLYVQAMETVRCLDEGVLTHPSDGDLGAKGICKSDILHTAMTREPVAQRICLSIKEGRALFALGLICDGGKFGSHGHDAAGLFDHAPYLRNGRNCLGDNARLGPRHILQFEPAQYAGCRRKARDQRDGKQEPPAKTRLVAKFPQGFSEALCQA